MFTINIVAFGESTYQGFDAIVPPGGDNPNYAVPKLVKDYISLAGVSCSMTNHAADQKRLSENAAGHDAFIGTNDLIVLICSGINDAQDDTVEDYVSTLKSLINEARQAGKIAVVQLPNAVATTTGYDSRVDGIRDYLWDSLRGSLGVRVAANTAPYGNDGVHPIYTGYEGMAATLYQNINLMSPAAVKSIGLAEVVTRIYIAGLARGPEQSGLDYWVGELAASILTEVQVANNVVAANPAFNSMTDAQFVSAIYQNVFNDGEADKESGQAYWVNMLSSASRGNVALAITVASVLYSGGDGDALARQRCFNNKIKMGLAYGLCARNDNVMDTADMAAITDTYSTVTDYTSGLFPDLPDPPDY